MDTLLSELKQRLLSDLNGDLEDFRDWLATVSRDAPKHGKEFEDLVLSVDHAFACFATGHASVSDLREELRQLAGAETVVLLTHSVVQQNAQVQFFEGSLPKSNSNWFSPSRTSTSSPVFA